MTYIEMKAYTKTIKHQTILDKINLSVTQGEVLGLLGRNASGKTMVLRAMSGLILPSSGSIQIANKELTASNRFPDSCGLIIESMSFWPSLTAKATLEILCSIKNIASTDDIKLTLERVGLDPHDTRTVRKFSLGMKQKLAIAQAIVERPDLLLLDEPTNSLDKEARLMFHDLIREEQDRGATIVMSSHIEDDLISLCDRVIEIDAGKLYETLDRKAI